MTRILVIILTLLMLGSTTAGAARRLDVLRQQSGWLLSANAAGLLTVGDSLRLSDVHLSAQGVTGHLADYSDASHSLQWGGEASSVFRLDSATVFTGMVRYDNFTGWDMSGSSWLDARHMAFDMVEYTPDRAGRKVRETYSLQGAVSHTLGRHWAVGAHATFTSANYAKQRDLRHQNRLMDLSVSPSVAWHTAHWTLGAHYTYRRRVEGIRYNMAGNTDQQYITLITYGAFLGLREYSTSGYDGYSSINAGDRPMVDSWHAVAMQAEWTSAQGRPSHGVRWFNEASFARHSGYYGRETPYTIVYEDHEGNDLAWHSLLAWGRQVKLAGEGYAPRHLVDVAVGCTMLNVKERIWSIQQQGGGFNQVVYSNKQQRLKRIDWQATAAYTWRHPLWAAHVQAAYWQRQQRVTYFPRWRRQTIRQWQAWAQGERRWLWPPRHLLEATLGAGWQQGNGTPHVDGAYTSGTVSTTLVAMDDVLDQHYAYLTDGQLLASAQLRYVHPWQGLPLRIYAAARYDMRHAPRSTVWSQPSRHILTLTLGCEF